MQRKTVYIAEGETRLISNKWAAECQERDTTVSSSTWEATGGTLASPALVGTTASVMLSAAHDGLLTNTVTLANGEVLAVSRLVSLSA